MALLVRVASVVAVLSAVASGIWLSLRHRDDNLRRLPASSAPETPPPPALERARHLRDDGQLASALRATVEVLLEDPFRREGYVILSQLLSPVDRAASLAFKERALALEPVDAELRRAAELDALGRAELAARARARAFARRGQFRAAEETLRGAAAATGSPGAWIYLAEHLVKVHKGSEALDVLSTLAARLGAHHPDVAGWSALARAALGDAEAAADSLASLCKRSRRVAAIWAPRLAALLLDELGAPEPAAAWSALAARASASRHARGLLARARFLLGDAPGALSVLDELGGNSVSSLGVELRVLAVRATLRIEGALDAIGADIQRLEARAAHRLSFQELLLEWMAATEAPAAELAAARQRLASQRKADAEARLLLQEAARTRSPPRRAEALLEAASIRRATGDRRAALRLARLAVDAERAGARAARTLIAWLDEPGDVFVRDALVRETAGDDSGLPRTSAAQLLARWPLTDAPAEPAVPAANVPLPGPFARFESLPAGRGVDFVHTGGSSTKEYILEMNGSGVALLDYDGDGRLDIFLVNGSHLPPPWGDGAGEPSPSDRLYRNLGELRFEDVTERSGILESTWGCGVAVADYDNDGDPDLYVTQYGPDRLLRNEGDGTFREVTAAAGLGDRRWGSSCAFLDYDRDGWLDLFVVHYLAFDPRSTPRRGEDPACQYRGVPIACGPVGLPAVACALYRNRGDGTFEDAGERAGIATVDPASRGYGLGIVTLDFDADGWIDVFVANDSRPNLLLRNLAGEAFEELGIEAGVGLSADGRAQAGMGTDAAFLAGRPLEDIFVVNFSEDSNTFYRNRGDGVFADETHRAGLLESGVAPLGWGTFFFDADLDGFLDLFIANGHVAPQVDQVAGSPGYRQRNLIYRGDGRGGFTDVSAAAGPAFAVATPSRGAAYGDLDGDGDLDIVINEIDAPASVLENTGRPRHHWLAVRPRGTTASRDALGAVVTVEAGGTRQRRRIRSGSSYASASELTARFGLGGATAVESVHIDWPTGRAEHFAIEGVDRVVTLTEGEGSSR